METYKQILVLGIGLDTKFDEISLLTTHKVYAIDLEETAIKAIYAEAHLETKVKIVRGNLVDLEESSVLDRLIAEGFDPNKSTFVIWEGGTFYLSASEVMKTLLYLKRTINITRFAGDFLNANVFHDKNHELKEMIEQVLTILKRSGNEWKGFFDERELKEFFFEKCSLKKIEMRMHGEVEASLYKEVVVIPDLIFFIECF